MPPFPPRIKLSTLTKRAEFLRVQAAPRIGTETLVLHILPNPSLDEYTSRIGYTVTKRCGNAVVRNRIKRRLRAAVQQVLMAEGETATDYVLVGKPITCDAPFAHITRDLSYALRRYAKQRAQQTAQEGL